MHSASKVLPIALTMGDAAGIGPELCARLLAREQAAPVIIYGDIVSLQRALELTKLHQVLELFPISHPLQLERYELGKHQLPIIQNGNPLPADLPYGQVNAAAGKMAHDAVIYAIDHALEGHIRALVTAPLHKDAMHQAGIEAPG